MKEFRGIGVSSGLVIGQVYVLVKKDIETFSRKRISADPQAEFKRYSESRERVLAYLQTIVKNLEINGFEERAGIFEGHMEFVDDEDAIAEIEKVLGNGELSAEAAVSDYYKECSNEMAAMDDPYFQERASDFLDVREKLLLALQGDSLQPLAAYPEDAVICCRELVPSDTALLDRTKVKGFVTETGSSTSHIAILAKALGLPAVAGVDGLLASVETGQFVFMDGSSGSIVLEPNQVFMKQAGKTIRDAQDRRQHLLEKSCLPAVTPDGRRIRLFSNIGSLDEAKVALQLGSEGIGLFRTEFLYAEKPQPLAEQELIEVFGAVADIFEDKPVIVRTLDVGGDKPLPWLDIPAGDNPFLGYRGIRIYKEFIDLITCQLRALLRANAVESRDLRIMFPMVISQEEVEWLIELVHTIESSLTEEGLAYRHCLLGIMIETPAASLMADKLAPMVDFISIGSNDLTQYTLAVDRGDTAVHHLYNPLHPAVKRSIEHIIAEAGCYGTEVGLCGELGGTREGIEFLAFLDIDEISISGEYILEARDLIRNMSM
ncbi:phosphotransferase system, enzyme I, PtsI [Alkalispirochaeta americana]|uniref:Phosphoenolpyruvate-protein phosphotransferase n=1 Tax=Alkalispirochaeta americana TaxID=159291 RepID=A0A1N6XQR2_9SPIO|nr:phosphoenolpyruvate--protein phosphotransferase [Alkalispirochaeta americana]SIR04541.1 phosphotransferase system, enzyme I, PtsI [Alkalispirochaeta americana]